MSRIGDKLKQIIGTVAPLLGGSLGGPLGGLAGKLVQDALGVDSDEAAVQMLVSDPDALFKIKTAEADFEVRMKELGIDEERLHAQDRDSARQREIAVKDKTPRNLAYAYTGGFFAIIGVQFYIAIAQIAISTPAVQMLAGTTGILTALMLGSKEYYFGSSTGSKAKTELLAKRNGA